ncbi:MAG: glycosyltransferase [Planctomycetes bacterium]|nr:glycosyltransferase [Planctomycetota bacterium]
MRLALVHDWLTGMRGGERCLAELCRAFPGARVYTLIHVPGSVEGVIEERVAGTSFLQHLPGVGRYYRALLPLFPAAVRSLSLRPGGHDAVLSLSHCVAHGVRVPPGVPHLVYCFTPMRYVREQWEDYFGDGRLPGPLRPLARVLADRLRAWDERAARRVDRYLAISRHVADRVRSAYGREAEVVYPPVDTARFQDVPPLADGEGDYLIVSALAPYKRIHEAVEACNRTRRRLCIVGSGQDERRLRALAGPTVRLLGWRPEEEVAGRMAACRAFLLPAPEEFGIAAVEAQAAGRPVIARAEGAALETVTPESGVLYGGGLEEALEAFEAREGGFDPRACRASAGRFSPGRFREAMARVLVKGSPAPAVALRPPT